MKSILCLFLSVTIALSCFSQQNPPSPFIKKTDTTAKRGVTASVKISPKPYKEVITEKAVTQTGLFTVHKVEDKWYFEIPDSLLNREILTITRFVKTPAGSRSYGGEKVNEQTFKWEKGPSDNIYLRVMTIVSIAPDSTQPIANAVRNSNVDPIAASFDIKAYGKDSSSVVIDVTDYFRLDNQPVSLSPDIKRRYNLGGIASDRSYISYIHSYPVNTEVHSIKTFNSSGSSGGISFGTVTGLPGAEAAGAVTMELNNSFIMLPVIPMRKRPFDPRVGYFASDYAVYTDSSQKTETSSFIHRWRLEPRVEDIARWNKGELVEPKKPIVFFIDPATPKQWRPYLIAGINDWQSAFEKAGFKNAIQGKEWPENDSSMNLEDARFSLIRYFASEIENAYGPNEADPRTGEILTSNVGWYHNVMKMLHDLYMIQAGAVDPHARKMIFSDSLMGSLIRAVAAHEIGHTLGLRHNMGSSSKTPVEKLRDKAWVEANGHTASIMDYARFNYVAQPEDLIGHAGMLPCIGVYDKWAIQWGYKRIPDTKSAEEDKLVLNRWIIDSLTTNPRLWFGGEAQNFDPRSQTEDLSDNAIKASEYGILNLKRIITELPAWTKQEADPYNNLDEMYTQLIAQFSRYMYHVTKNVAGIYETLKTVEQPGDVYEPTPKNIQAKSIIFLQTQLFQTPYWLLDKNILNKISSPAAAEAVSNTQGAVLNSLLTSTRLFRMESMSDRYGKAVIYAPDDLISDLEKGIWKELRNPQHAIDPFRRNLQKQYVDIMISLMNPSQPSLPAGYPRGLIIFFGADIKNTDIPSIARGHLSVLRNRMVTAAHVTSDKISKYHLQDMAERIRQAMNPK